LPWLAGAGGQDRRLKPDFNKCKVINQLLLMATVVKSEAQEAFVRFVRAGGVLSPSMLPQLFSRVEEYNQMIGLGGWGDRRNQDRKCVSRWKVV
jgi:hypothetical protein